MRKTLSFEKWSRRDMVRLCALTFVFIVCLLPCSVSAADSICARVKIEIVQELTLERQAFDAHMRINNGLTSISLENVDIDVSLADKDGNTVRATFDPDDATALFFIRVNSMENISNIDGQGAVQPSSIADVHWLIIPAPGASNGVAQGTLYYVGATLTYTIGGEPHETKVTPDYIFVKPMPEMVLDYFLTKEVYGDDAFTPELEPPVPFTLGVRVSNNGSGAARNVKIDSAQPKIVDNQQGLLLGFNIEGSEVNGQAATRDLLVSFGDILSETSAVARWIMTCTLSGKFVAFSADFSHANELGGEVTSLIDAVNTHFLLRDVLVDLPGRDGVRDFLALDGSALRVFESQNTDAPVMDQSGAASLQLASQAGAQTTYTMTLPATAGFLFVKIADPYGGVRVLKEVLRADGKRIKAENAWLSATRAEDLAWQHCFNLFDVSTGGSYRVIFDDPASEPHPPVLPAISDQQGAEGKELSFAVEASDPDATIPALSAAPLPALAGFSDQGDGRALFTWTPVMGQAGRYAITFTASDGLLKTSQTAAVTICAAEDTDCDGLPDAWELTYFGTLSRDGTGDADNDGKSDLEEFQQGTDPTRGNAPTIPVVASPLDRTEATTLTPDLVIHNSSDADGDIVTYAFELYADAEMTTLIAAQAGLFGGSEMTAWTVPQGLPDNAWYTWRVRATDGQASSEWASASFFVNTANDPPGSFAISAPQDQSEVDKAMPVLQVANSVDIDQDPLTYRFEVYADGNMANLIAFAEGVAPGPAGSTSWTVNVPLTEDAWHFWRAVASDAHGAATSTVLASFFVNTVNGAPTAPLLASPAMGSEVSVQNVDLVVNNAVDPEDDDLTYAFELDRVETFDSPARMSSGALPSGVGLTAWSVPGLADNALYFWRAKANDGAADGPWASGGFFVNTANDPPSLPTVKNPGDRAWVETLTPVLELNPAVDVDRDAVSYIFEVYADTALTTLVMQQEADAPRIVAPFTLADNTWYAWRATARDEHGSTSGWTGISSFFVNNNGSNDPPEIALEKPAEALFTTAGPVLVSWKDNDPDSDAEVALFYDAQGAGFAGSLLVDGFKEDPDGPADAYLWDVSGMPDGAYYVYGTITDGTSSRASYAPGTVTIDRTPPLVEATPRGGTYATPQNVVLAANEPATITFTLDGSNPTKDSPRYGVPIPVAKTTTIKFVAVDRAGNESGVTTETYTIGEGRRVWIAGAAFNYPEHPACDKRALKHRGSILLTVTGPSAPSGLLTYVFSKAGIALISTKIKEVTVSGNLVIINGVAKANGKAGYTFTATVSNGKKDSFSIVIMKPDGSLFYSAPLKPACEGDIVIIPLE